MNRYKKHLKTTTLTTVLIAILLTTACSGSPSEKVTNLEAKVTSLETQLASVNDNVASLIASLQQAKEASIQAQVSIALRHIEAAEFHIMNINIQEGDLNPRYPATVDQVVTAISFTEWPADLTDMATAFIESAKSLSAVLVAEDAVQAGPISTATHGLYHALTAAAWVWLNGGEELGADPHAGHNMSNGEGHEEHDMSSMATPEPTMDHSSSMATTEPTTEPTANHSSNDLPTPAPTAEPTADPQAGHNMPTATPDPHAGHKMD